MKNHTSARLLAVAVPFALLFTGCTVNDSEVNTAGDAATAGEAWQLPEDKVGEIKVQSELAALVPEKYQKEGLIIGNDGESLPLKTEVDGVSRGFEGDLSRGVAAVLGLETKTLEVDFDGLIPAIKAGRIDMVASGMADYTERQAEIDFVDYFESAISLLVVEGNPQNVKVMDDLCGIRVATLRGSGAASGVEAQSEKCVEAGKEPIDISAFPDTPAATNQLLTGRADAVTNDYPLAVYSALTLRGGGAVDIVDEPLYGGFYYGLGLGKDDPELRDAVQGALQYLIDSGWYGELLSSYDLDDAAVEVAAVNGGGDRPFSD